MPPKVGTLSGSKGSKKDIKSVSIRSFFLSPDAAENLAKYQYHAGQYTTLDSFFNPFWLKVASFVPRWISPNMVTLTGFTFFTSCCLATMNYYVDYQFLTACGNEFEKSGFIGVSKAAATPNSDGLFTNYLGKKWDSKIYYDQNCLIPASIFYALSFATFIYQTLDAVDGKHARNTNQSTPLGALFDHGCDAFVTVILLTISICGLYPSIQTPNGPGDTNSVLGVCSFILINATWGSFFFSQWEHHHTGVLPTAGVTEGHVMVIGLCITMGLRPVRDFFTSPLKIEKFFPALGEAKVIPGGGSSGKMTTTDFLTEYVGVKDNVDLFVLWGPIMPIFVSLQCFVRTNMEYYLGFGGSARFVRNSGDIWSTSSGFWLGILCHLLLFLCPSKSMWVENWMKISIMISFLFLYLSLRSILSGLCSVPLRGLPRTLYPAYFTIFALFFSELYKNEISFKTWGDNYLVPGWVSLITTVILPAITTALKSSTLFSATSPFPFVPVLLPLFQSAQAFFDENFSESSKKPSLGALFASIIDFLLSFLPQHVFPGPATTTQLLKSLCSEHSIVIGALLWYLLFLNCLFFVDCIYNICRKLGIPFLAPLREPWNICK